MKNGKIRIVFGWILVVLQVVSWFGLSSANMKLWNDADDTYQYISSSSSSLNFAEWCCAFEIGNEKFINSFDNMFAKEDEYIPLTSNEFLSIYIRESLGARDENFSFSLLLFDFNILIGYMFYGILGLFLLIFGYKAKNLEITSSLDDIENHKSKKSKIVCIILLCLALILKILYLEISLTTISLIFLFIFFVFYIGKKKSILLSSAITLFAIDALWRFFTTIYNWFFMDTDSLNFWTFPTLIFVILSLIMGIVYLICGIKLYSGKEKNSIKKLNVVASIFAIIATLVWPILLSVTYDALFVTWIEIPNLFFAIVLTIYIIKIPYQITSEPIHDKSERKDINIADFKEQVESQEHIQKNIVEEEEHNETEEFLDNGETTEKAQDYSEEKVAFSEDLLFCRKCGSQLLTDSIYCNKCGTKVEHL